MSCGRGAAASPATIRLRRDVCRDCDQATRSAAPCFAKHNGLTTLSTCRLCNCFIATKTKLAAEACPAGRWSRQ